MKEITVLEHGDLTGIAARSLGLPMPMWFDLLPSQRRLLTWIVRRRCVFEFMLFRIRMILAVGNQDREELYTAAWI